MNDSLLPPSDRQINSMRTIVLDRIARRRRRKRTATVVSLVSATVLVAAGATAGAVVAFGSIDAQNTSFECYTTTSLDGTHVMALMGDSDRQKERLLSTEQRVAKAIEVCTVIYPSLTTDPVPHPTACLLKDNRLGVFPNRDNQDVRGFCLALGLRPPQN